MAKLKVLIEGYAELGGETEHASSSVTLLEENDVKAIVDPGMDKTLLLKRLKEKGLSPDSINYVVLTHTHLDHCYLVGIFNNAKVLDNDSMYSAEGIIAPHDGKIPGTNIEIIKTPGHDQFHCAVLADTDEFGKVAVVGDVFWWKAGDVQETRREDLLKHDDPYMKNKTELVESRKRVLDIADYIVPGHGKMFKTNI